MTREYILFLKGESDPISITAEDVNLVSADAPTQACYLNFWEMGDSEEHTVAVVPFEQVRFVISEARHE